MLMIDQRLTVERFPDLEDLTVAAPTDRGRIQAEHRIQTELLAPLVARHYAHPPVGYNELVSAARSSLVIEQTVDDAVLHEVPTGRFCAHVHPGHLVLTTRHLVFGRHDGGWWGLSTDRNWRVAHDSHSQIHLRQPDLDGEHFRFHVMIDDHRDAFAFHDLGVGVRNNLVAALDLRVFVDHEPDALFPLRLFVDGPHLHSRGLNGNRGPQIGHLVRPRHRGGREHDEHDRGDAEYQVSVHSNPLCELPSGLRQGFRLR